MRVSVLSLLLAAPLVTAFPWLTPNGMDALLNHPEAKELIERKFKEYYEQEAQSKEKRQLGDIVGGAGDLINGVAISTVGSVLGLFPLDSSVKGLKRFPESSHPFKAPGKTDVRGPCPGLNTMANHGYIPRTGIATVGQIIDAAQTLFNMGPDLGALLAVGGALDGGDIVTQKMSIGGADDRVSLAGSGLNMFFGTPSGITGHGKFNEGDASATRADFYLNNGDNYSFQPAFFKQMHQQALAKGKGAYTMDAIKEHFKNRYQDSFSRNKQFYFNLPSSGVVMGAYSFIPGFFSNGSYIDGTGIPNEASITSFYGAQRVTKGAKTEADVNYVHVPERIPEQGWYRRKTPMTVLEAVERILEVYLYAKPAMGGRGADGAIIAGPVSIPSDAQGLSCFLYNAIYANFPSSAFNSVRLLAGVVNLLSSRLAPGYKALGCKVDFGDASGTPGTYAKYSTWANTYTGLAKTQAPGSGWYGK